MHRVILLWVGLLAGDVHDYSRPLAADKFDQAALDAGSFGEKKGIKREADGLRISVAPGEAETGWKTPQTLKIGGNFTITANVQIHKLPKPAQEDGVAVGLAIASQNLDQPEATLIRLVETDGAEVYRSIDKPTNAQPGMKPGMVFANPMMMMRQGAGGKPPKPPRHTFRAKGPMVRLELRREGTTVRYYVLDSESNAARYVGQVEIGSNDVAGAKLFVTNRNGAEAVEVTLHDLAVHADRITGLGTEVRTIFGEIVHGDPTAIEDGRLIVGGPPKPAPPPATPPTTSKDKGTANNSKKDEAAKKEESKKDDAKKETPKQEEAKKDDAKKEEPKKDDAKKDKPKKDEATKKDEPKKDEATKKDEPKKDDAAKKDESKKGDAAKKDESKKPTPPAKPEPKAKIAFDEVDAIAFERALTVSGRFLGQPNLDFTRRGVAENKDGTAKTDTKTDDVLAPPPGTVAAVKIPKLEPEPSGVCDLHLSLANLRTVAIKQVTINAQSDKGPTSWRLDTTDSRDWPLVLRRAGTETWADLFLEPPDGDLNGKDFTINISYSDGQSANATVKADKKTDPKLPFNAKAAAPSLDARVYLTGDEQLFGKFERLDEESLRLRTPWGDRLTVPLARVTGIYMGLAEHKESSESFAKRLRSRGTEDLLLAQSKSGEVVAIPGIAEGTEDDKLRFQFQEKSRTLPLKQVEGLVLAARPEPERPAGLRPTFSMAGGIVISGLWKDLDAKTWKIETAWGEVLDLPAAEVRDVRFRGGQMSYLSDLEPSHVEEIPYFGRRTPWRKDVNLTGEPLKIDGRTYEHGLAVHSRSSLTYDLNGQYATFEALVGFDESAKELGRVECRVFADGKELYANKDLRADAPPVKLTLPVAGAAQLRLVVDFGPDQDTGDRVIWANPRLFRRPPPKPKPADAKQPPSQPNADPPKTTANTNAKPQASAPGSGQP